MIFKPILVDRIVAGTKTMTRRRGVHRDGRPLRYAPGNAYALQPGRGKRHVGHLMIEAAYNEPLGFLTRADARAEGFASIETFRAYWIELHGAYDPGEIVAVYAFRYAGRLPCCAPWPQTASDSRG